MIKTSAATIQRLAKNAKNNEMQDYIFCEAIEKIGDEGETYNAETYDKIENCKRGWWDIDEAKFTSDPEGDDFLISWWDGSNTQERVADGSTLRHSSMVFIGCETYTKGSYQSYENFFLDEDNSIYVELSDNVQQNITQEVFDTGIVILDDKGLEEYLRKFFHLVAEDIPWDEIEAQTGLSMTTKRELCDQLIKLEA